MTPIVGWSCSGSFLRAKSSIFAPYPLPRAASVTNRWPISPVCGRRRPYRRQRPRVVQIERPTVLFLVCQVRQPEVRRHFFEIFLVADRRTDRAAALGHEGGTEGELFVIFHKAHIFAALPLGQLGQRVASRTRRRTNRGGARGCAPGFGPRATRQFFCGHRSAARAARRGPPRPRGGCTGGIPAGRPSSSLPRSPSAPPAPGLRRRTLSATTRLASSPPVRI